MGETRDPDKRPNDAPETPTTSSILGQAPFKLDLRIVPRTSPGGGPNTGEVPRLTPVDRDLLPDQPAPVAQVIELPSPTLAPAPTPSPSSETAAAPSSPAAGVGTALADAPSPSGLTAPPSPPVPPPPPAQIVAPGVSAPMPTATAPFASRSIPLPGQLTLAPIAPRVEPKPIDFNAVLGSQSYVPTGRLKHKRNPFGLLVKLLVVAGLIGGGYLAVKKFVLTPKWQDDVKALADGVAERRGLSFDEAVTVEALPYDDYALALASSVLGVPAADAAILGAEWRAMGLATGTLDPQVIGRVALADQPAFYDPQSGKIFELAGLSPELRGIALSRALTMALLDQHFDWSAPADPAVRLGRRALFEGDAAAIGAETAVAALVDNAQVAEVSRELGLLRIEAMDDAAAASPFAVAMIGLSGEATSHLFQPSISTLDRNRIEQATVASDAAVFDAGRGRESQPADMAAVGAKSVGMMYWYYALAGRIGSEAAWDAAIHWNGDATVVERIGAGSTCVTSTIATVDQVGQLSLMAALQLWATAGPAAANASVTAEGTDRLVVKSCDPGSEAPTLGNADIAPFGDAPSELAVVGAMVANGMPDDDASRSCVVAALRSGQVVGVDVPTDVDRSLTTPTVDLVALEAQLLQETCAAG